MAKIGVLTGGGDCPGLNPAIKAVVVKASELGLFVVGIKEGWKGLEDGMYVNLDSNTVRHIDSLGGTILGTSRTNPFKSKDGILKLKKNFVDLKLDALIAIGGEDTLGVAFRLFKEH